MPTNATIRYSGASKDLWGIVTLYFKKKSFVELYETFELSSESYPSSKLQILNKITSKSAPTLGYFRELNKDDLISYTTNKDGTLEITPSNQLILLVLFIKDIDAMNYYVPELRYMSKLFLELIEDLEVKEEYPEYFI